MKKFELTYNPFTHERTFLANGKPAILPKCWGDDDSKELSEWCGDFFQSLRDKYNDSEMEVRFKGILRDLEFLQDALEAYRKDNPSDKITLDGKGCVNTTAKLDKLKKLFAKMQAESPFPELKTQELKDMFEETVSGEFEMAVVGTMSSGKSTIINAMLGCELLPERNTPTTATLAKIHDIEGMTGFRGTSYDAEGNVLENCDPLSKEDMERMNNNITTSTIDIYGDAVGVESNDIKLVLTDTPGPNNSGTEKHREHTFRLIDADYKPMILYVLNSTQLGTTDDIRLLTDVAKAMHTGGRQAQERFIFILNKADNFDFQNDENIEIEIEKVRNSLAEHEIQDARVFPTSALMAKVIRQFLGGDNHLTKMEKQKVLSLYELYIEEPSMFFSDFAPLSQSARKRFNADLDDARNKNDKYREALLHTGIPALEQAISEYLAKYALPAKIAEGVNAFQNKIKELGIEARATEELKDNEDAVEKQRAYLDKLESDLKNGRKSEYVMRVIDSLSIHDEIEKQFEQIQDQFISRVNLEIQKKRCSSLSMTEAQNRKNDLLNVINDLNMQVRIDMERAINKTFAAKAQDAITVYKKYLEELTGALPSSTPFQVTLGYLTELTVDSIGKDYVKKERIKVGSHKEKDGRNSERGRELGKTIGEGISCSSGPLGWCLIDLIGDISSHIGGAIGGLFDKEHEVADYKYETRYDFSLWLDKDFYPLVYAFVESRRDVATKLANRLEKDFKASFKAKFSELEKVIKQKIKEKKKAIADKESLEKTLGENERRLEWLKKFINDLDKVLVI